MLVRIVPEKATLNVLSPVKTVVGRGMLFAVNVQAMVGWNVVNAMAVANHS